MAGTALDSRRSPYSLRGFPPSASQSRIAEPLEELALGEIVEPRSLGLGALGHHLEPTHELPHGSPQRALRVDAELAGERRHREQHVADLLLQRVLAFPLGVPALVRTGGFLELAELLAHLLDGPRELGPVEPLAGR